MPSAPLIPENDPSTLFTGSGMQPMVPYLLGQEHPEGRRIADSQKCFRAVDIDDVGDNRHTTFFEMLGNWSLGDPGSTDGIGEDGYFKKEQINWVFEFLTQELGLDPSRLYISVYQGNKELGIPKDEEAAELWKQIFKEAGVDAEISKNAEKEGMCKEDRIFYFGDKDNWWSRVGVPRNMPVGEPGGPDSEIFWDLGKDLGLHERSQWKDQPCHPACDCGRFLEIGNSVFMQYKKTADGFKELDGKNIDFGGGLERLAMAVNDDPDIFLSDLFKDLRGKIEDICGKEYGRNNKETKAFRVLMDHLRAAVFLIGDGAVPSNKDQGYFTRRLLRRAIRFAYDLGIDRNFTKDVAVTIIDGYAPHYGRLKDEQNGILAEMEKEENKFRKTLKQGLKEFERIADNKIDGKQAFDLFQTYGYPVEMTEELAAEKGMDLSHDFRNEYEKAMKEHQELSRTASAGKFKGGLADSSKETKKLHTAAHLLLAALRRVLGDHVEQKGSNITSERLRFDFSHPEKLSSEQKAEVESLVNEAIEADMPISCEELDLEEARDKGAMGSFGSKYGQKVKVYKIGLPDNIFSYEICGGPHVDNTGELGSFKIKKEESSSAGVRRIKATLDQDQ